MSPIPFFFSVPFLYVAPLLRKGSRAPRGKEHGLPGGTEKELGSQLG